MQAYDLFMLIVLGAAVAWGAWKGFAWQLASLASIVVSYFVALNFRQPLAQMIQTDPPWNMFLAMLILFLGTSLVVWMAFNFLSNLIEKVKLKEFDRQVGALFGLAKGVILCVLITLFAVTLLDRPRQQAICNSRSGFYIAQLLDRADAIMPQEVHKVLDPYIRELDENGNFPGDQPEWQRHLQQFTDQFQTDNGQGGFNPGELLNEAERWRQSMEAAPRIPADPLPTMPPSPYGNQSRQPERFNNAY
jgi:membrane protein required for colicin V production